MVLAYKYHGHREASRPAVRPQRGSTRATLRAGRRAATIRSMSQKLWPTIPLPRGWSSKAKSLLVCATALAHKVLVFSRSVAVNSKLQRVRLQVTVDELSAENAMLREELRIKDDRTSRIPARTRPHFPPQERLAILQLQAARGWSTAQTARRMFLEAKTLAAWRRRCDEDGAAALVQTHTPVNRFPDLVREQIRALNRLLPSAGAVRIAQVLARAAMHVSASTVRRVTREKHLSPSPATETRRPDNKPVTSRGPNDVWEIDFTLLPRVSGFWVPWVPHSLLQVWPFTWWMAAVIDHSSRTVVGWKLFQRQPSYADTREFLRRTIRSRGQAPRYLISDLGPQFANAPYRRWCRTKHGVVPRYAAAHSIRATSVIERFFRTMKAELPGWRSAAFRKADLERKLHSYLDWYHDHRPHQGLGGRTPHEVHDRVPPGNQAPRWEPRARWPADSTCARPAAPIREGGRANTVLEVEYLDGQSSQPIVRLRAA